LHKTVTGFAKKSVLTSLDLNVVQIMKIYIAVQCIFDIFLTAFMHIINLLTRPMYLPCIDVYSETVINPKKIDTVRSEVNIQ